MEPLDRALIIETSGKIGQVALGAGATIVGSRILVEARRHARDLAALCSELLRERGWHARDLTAVIVGTGPGSYTGLRVGIVSAKTLAYATDCALYGVPTFDAIAIQSPHGAATLDVIADAQQGNVYCERFGWIDGKWLSKELLAIRSVQDWSQTLPDGALVAGPAVEMYKGNLPAGVTKVSAQMCQPRPASLLELVNENAGAYRADLWEIQPIYLRGSSAEEKRKRE